MQAKAVSRRWILSSEDTRQRLIAWPTVLMTFILPSLWFYCIYLASIERMSSGLVMVLGSLIAYSMFTPMHDAAHRAVSRNTLFNTFIGHFASIVLLTNYMGFRAMHLLHHRYTNNSKLDPDFWSGKGPFYLLPFRWLTQDLHYYYLIFKSLFSGGLLSAPDAARVAFSILPVVLIQGLLATWIVEVWGWEVFLWQWFLPARVAVGLLAFGFDFIPHFPYSTTAKENKLQATRAIDSKFLTWVMLGQNYHLIHHLFPAVPFYRYRSVYKKNEALLKDRGAVLSLLPGN